MLRDLMINHLRLETMRRALLMLFVVFPLVACEDEFGPQDWVARPDTITLYSLSRAEYLNRGSAIDFRNGTPRPVEASLIQGEWDAVLIEQNNQLYLAPAGWFQGVESRAAIGTPAGVTNLEAYERAPSDTAAYSKAPVLMRTGQVYVVRTRLQSCGFGSGVFYGKFEVLEPNIADGTLRFRSIVNDANCNDRDLIPPDSD